MTDRLLFALDAATQGGRSTLAHFQNAVGVELKDDETPVTVADREAERLIREAIAGAYPREHILGEEEGGDLGRPDRWIIDPIDGTKAFVASVPLYATLLSYEVDRQPVVGVCYFPGLDEIVYAEAGSGAFWNGRRCRVSGRPGLAGGTLSFSGPRRLERLGLLPAVLRLAERAADERTWNDAYGHALVATGRVEAMLDPGVSLWDVSALDLIVQEAGGRTSGLNGRTPLDPNPQGRHDLFSANPHVMDEILRELEG